MAQEFREKRGVGRAYGRLGVAILSEVTEELARGLREHGWRVVGAQLYPGRRGWVGRILVVIEPGEVVPIEVGLAEPRDSPTCKHDAFSDSTGARLTSSECSPRWRRGLEGWERPLVAAAMYMVDPRPEDEVLRDMAELVGRGEAERLASLVWRIAYGEGYSLDEWAGLLESLTILSPWECIWRFQELAGKGYRRRHDLEPASLRDKEVLRHACKLLGFGLHRRF